MKELVVISGKGGTGKTSLVASFAVLSGKTILADCDVDAADLHLVLDPTVVRRERFFGGSQARILSENCTACGKCEELCRFDAIAFDGPGNGKVSQTFSVDPVACEGCGVCAHFCEDQSIAFEPALQGEWFVSATRCGTMVHAKLGVAAENSGKLVSLVRTEAKKAADAGLADLILIDGAPGIGCPVIATISGADLVLAVTEPTLSGLHDLVRVLDLTRHFGLQALVCINKWDLNEEISANIEKLAVKRGSRVVGKIRYDQAVTQAQIKKLSVVEYGQNGAATDIRKVWDSVKSALG